MPTDLTDWTSLMAVLWQRVRRRGWAVGSEWPRTSTPAATGVVTSADGAAGTISDSTQSWPTDYWYASTSGHVYGPRFFDLVVDLAANDTPQQILHFKITGNTATALSVTPLDVDPVVGGQIASWSAMAGKKYTIISANSPDRGLWWSERIPQWPRARSRWRGQVKTVTASPTDATVLTVECKDAIWTPGEFNGFDLIYLDTASKQRRVTITSSTANTLKITTPNAPMVGRDLDVIVHGGLWHNVPGEKIFSWHQSPGGGDDGGPASSVTVYDFDFDLNIVIEILVPCFDKEVWGEYDIPQIAYPDRCYTPNWLKTFRGLQVTLETFAPYFVPVANYDGATSIPTYTWETLKAAAGLTSAGWRRFIPREFRYAYDKTAWVPDDRESPGVREDELNNDGSIKVLHTGRYLTRPKSTKNSEYNDGFGHRSDPFSPASDGPDAFADGQIARYIGDNHGDGFDLESNGRFFTSTPPPPVQPHGDAGSITSAGTLYLIDNTKHWAGGDLIVHSGTATGGSATSLTDSTKAASSFWIHPDRGRWLGHWVEVQTGVDDAGNPVYEQRPITVHDGGATVGWVTPLSVTANGKAYRIREPVGDLNRWAERYVRVADPSGNNWRVKVAYCSDMCLWFASALPVTPQPGWSYSIEELQIGGSYKRVGGEWVKATGTDGRANRHGVQFPSEPAALVPDSLSRFGRFYKGDYVGQWLIDDMTAVLDLMLWTKSPVAWMMKSSDAADNEKNRRIGSADAEDITTPYPGPYNLAAIFATAKGRAEAGYAFDPFNSVTYSDGSAGGGPVGDTYFHVPAGSARSIIERNECDVDLEAVYAYPRTAVYYQLQANVDFLAFQGTDAGDLTAFLNYPWDGSEATFTGQSAGLKYNKWSLVTTGTTDSLGVVYGSKVGGAPPRVVAPDGQIYGYAVTDQIAIVKWNMN